MPRHQINDCNEQLKVSAEEKAIAREKKWRKFVKFMSSCFAFVGFVAAIWIIFVLLFGFLSIFPPVVNLLLHISFGALLINLYLHSG